MNETPPASGKTATPKRACAICGRPRDPKYDPFCSKRCADVDLHRWLKGTYVIPGAERPSVERDSDEEEEGASGARAWRGRRPKGVARFS